MKSKNFKILTNIFPLFSPTEVTVEYFQTGRGNQGLRINDYTYKRHYETATSIYWICTLSNKLKCKQRVIAEKEKPYAIRFKGKGHNHDLSDYLQMYRGRGNLISSVNSIRKEITKFVIKEEKTESS
jgi:hypothetical protein